MRTPFKLDDHPRRSQPLTPPPAGYFDRLPTQIMGRVQSPARDGAWAWLQLLSPPLRTMLASVVVLAGFAVAFLLQSAPASQPHAAERELAAVPRTEMMQYLLTSNDRLTVNDLSELSVADDDIAQEFLHASPAEVQAALDALPYETTYL